MKAYASLLDYESGTMMKDDMLKMFAALIDSGDIWKLPDNYLDAAAWFVESGNYASHEEAKRGLN